MKAKEFVDSIESIKDHIMRAQTDVFEDNTTQIKRNLEKTLFQQPLAEKRMRNLI